MTTDEESEHLSLRILRFAQNDRSRSWFVWLTTSGTKLWNPLTLSLSKGEHKRVNKKNNAFVYGLLSARRGGAYSAAAISL